MSICHYNVFLFFSDSYEKAKEKLQLAENISDLTADDPGRNTRSDIRLLDVGAI